MEYANRESEYNTVKNYLQSHSSPIIIHAYHASGVTSFIKNKLDKLCTSLFGSSVFYIDASANKPLGEALLSCIISTDQLSKLQMMADKKYGKYGKSLLSAALEGIPYAGSLLGRISEQRAAAPVYAGAYPSAIEELLLPFFRKTANNIRYLIIIDAVEMLHEASYSLLVSLLQCDTIHFILVKTEETLQFNKLENALFEHGISTSFHVEFDRPQIKLIKEIGRLYDVELCTEEAKAILDSTHQNIHVIVKQIRSIRTNSMDLPLSAFEKAVVFILHIWAEPIEEKGLAEIVVLSEVFAPDPNNAIQNALRSLRERKIITCEGQKWGLTGRFDPQVLKVLSGIPDKLFYKNIIYNYLSQGKINHSELRYHLSKDLDCTTQTDAQLYLRHLLIQGKEVPHTVSVEANLKKGIRNDCLLSGITYCRERKYQAAFEWIDSIPSAQMTDDVEAFRAILLNRIRRSEEAEVAIMKCLEKTMEPSRQNILRAFLISTYIHMERLADAQKVYNNGKNLNSSSPLHGYLVRNATSAFSGYQKELYEEALSEFEHDGDDFGYYSTLCNQGYALCKNGDPHNALLLLNEAQKGLEFFPKTNLHIIYNNLGICHLMLDNYQDAYNFLFLARKLAANALPWIFATINLACLEAVMGKTENALLQLDSIEASVTKHKLDRVRQQYYINRLLVEYLHGNKRIQPLIDNASRYLDRYNPARTQSALRVYKRFMASKKLPQRHKWKDLYFPCGLVYWYVDPLKLLPEGII